MFPTALRNGQSPNSLWRNTPERLSRLKTFGCREIMYKLIQHIKWKLDSSRKPGIFIGSKNNNTAYCIPQLNYLKLLITLHSTFHENAFPSIPQMNMDKTTLVTELDD
ncbi:hypothetical protein O181_098162 [Austropuccinia psidii MF-1]|uniref:Uncharacterized protein n=1 Tax=Austropuccinia psidii MF-1 TaxID=1389203 RepID=A0A9Q3J9V7_9BASI|nr:hypothetical protein [Austropuccinia psidii MF-1]